MSASDPRLPGAGVTVRIPRDDGVTFAGVTLAVGGNADFGARIAAAPGLSAAEIARARAAGQAMTHSPREPTRQGAGWAVYQFPGSTQVYVLRDDGTHLSYGAPQAMFLPSAAVAALGATAGLSGAEAARIASIG